MSSYSTPTLLHKSKEVEKEEFGISNRVAYPPTGSSDLLGFKIRILRTGLFNMYLMWTVIKK